MIDSIQLMLRGYEILPSASLMVKPAPFRASSGEKVGEYYLWKDTSGNTIYGSSAYGNYKLENDASVGVDVRAYGSKPYCFVNFSIPKVHNGNNFYSVGRQGSETSIDRVEQLLSEQGIKTNLKNACISRIDTFKNIQAMEPYTTYYGLFSLLRINRGIQRGYGTTFMIANNQQKFIIYDKLVEMKSRGIETSSFPAQTIRFEQSLKNKEKVSLVNGFNEVDKLLEEDYYQRLKVIQSEQWKKNLFRYSVEDVITLSSRQLVNELSYYQQKYKRNWLQKYKEVVGSDTLVSIIGIEAVMNALRTIETDKVKLWRFERDVMESKRELDMLREEEGSKKSKAELYEELRKKVCLN